MYASEAKKPEPVAMPAPLESVSLPDIHSPTKQMESPSKTPKALSKSTQKRFEHAETMLRRQIRQQAKNLMYMFKIADADGSGELDAEELRGALYKENILIEDRHFETLMAKMDQDGEHLTVSHHEEFLPIPR